MDLHLRRIWIDKDSIHLKHYTHHKEGTKNKDLTAHPYHNAHEGQTNNTSTLTLIMWAHKASPILSLHNNVTDNTHK